MDGMQSAKGLRGPFIIKKKEDRNAAMYDEEKVIVLAGRFSSSSQKIVDIRRHGEVFCARA